MLVLNLPAFKNEVYTAYDCFHGNGLYGKILTKKEPIKMLGFAKSHIIKWLSCILSGLILYRMVKKYLKAKHNKHG